MEPALLSHQDLEAETQRQKTALLFRNAGIAQGVQIVLEGDRERCLAAGMDDYLSKPLTRQSLHSTLCRWIRPE